MSRLKTHTTYDDDEPTRPLAFIHPASTEIVTKVLNANELSSDGRSQWMWLRLPNGDLILGVFPMGNTYEMCEQDAEYREVPVR